MAKDKEIEIEVTENEAVEDEGMVIALSKPYMFEGKEYTTIDLTALDDLTANDMIATNKYMERTSGGITIMPEVTLEYACVLASKATKQPIEFFMGLRPKDALKVKNRVMGFLYGQD